MLTPNQKARHEMATRIHVILSRRWKWIPSPSVEERIFFLPCPENIFYSIDLANLAAVEIASIKIRMRDEYVYISEQQSYAVFKK